MVSPTAAQVFERAVQCHRAGKTAEAERLYRTVLSEDPGHHPSLHLLSTLALQEGRDTEAAAMLERAVELAPEQPVYHANLGEVYRRLGQLPEAARALSRALAIQPDFAEAAFNVGVVLETNEELESAIAYYERAADLKPGMLAFQRALARALWARGEVARAVGHLECAVVLEPRSIESVDALAAALDYLRVPEVASAVRRRRSALPGAIARPAKGANSLPTRRPSKDNDSAKRGALAAAMDRARTHEQAGRMASAVAAYKQALERAPGHGPALLALGRLALVAGESADAASWLARAAALEPESAVYSDLGEAYRNLGRTGEAMDALSKALALAPEDARASNRLGLLYEALRDVAALDYFERAAALRPDVLKFQTDLARALRDSGAFERAVAHYHAALACDPRRADTLAQLGRVLRTLGRTDAAIATLRRALDADPSSVDALTHLGATLFDMKQFDDAILSCERAVALGPASAEAHFQLGNALVSSGRIDEAIASWRRTCTLDPTHVIARSNIVWMASYSPGFDGPAILEEARAWAQHHAEPAPIRPHENDRTLGRRLRIGYVSGDFRDHSAAYFLVPLLASHDRDAFQIHAYSSVPKADGVTERIRAHTDAWRDIARMSNASVEGLVRQDGIDILVDLSMHTGRGRPLLFARKPAPVQIAWLAYPGTTGLPTIDYRITDPHLDPPELGPGPYSEASLVLPETFWCYDPLGPSPDVSALPALSAGHVTFGCQNSFYKIHADVLDLWARVLRAVDASRLIAHAPPHVHASVVARLEALGIAPARVTLVPHRGRPEYLATYSQIDIGLDTFPFNGATTSLDSFWMGVPVVTLVGSTVVGRAGRCLALNLGLPELVADTPDLFEKAAAGLANDLFHLSALRSDLRARLQSSPLMDSPRFARHMEDAYRRAWRTWVERKEPQQPRAAPQFQPGPGPDARSP